LQHAPTLFLLQAGSLTPPGLDAAQRAVRTLKTKPHLQIPEGRSLLVKLALQGCYLRAHGVSL